MLELPFAGELSGVFQDLTEVLEIPGLQLVRRFRPNGLTIRISLNHVTKCARLPRLGLINLAGSICLGYDERQKTIYYQKPGFFLGI